MDNEPEYTSDFNEIETAFDFSGFEDAFDCEIEQEIDIEKRFIKPPKFKAKVAYWKNAKATAKELIIEPGCNYFGYIDGSFIFGDLIEAILVGQQIGAHRLDISTLSMSQENIDSLRTLLEKGYIKELNLIVSDYFYAHEKRTLIPYLVQQLDIDNKFQIAVAGCHTKITAAKLSNGVHLVMHGSANLRSSGNMEQVMVSDSEEIYNFVIETNNRILEKFKTIEKSVRRAVLWHGVTDSKILTAPE
jgi:hypothetical protein